MARRFDRHEATSTARIERLQRRVQDAQEAEPEPLDGEVDEAYGVSESELSDLHITTGEDDLPDEATDHVVVAGDDVMDALCEVFNARDLDTLMELCAPDCEIPGLASDMAEVGPALDDLWMRRPTVTMTRMVVDEVAVGVLWERVSSDGWGTIGTVHLDIEDDLVEVMEFSDAIDLIDRRNPEPPEVDDPIWQDPDEMVVD